MLTTGRLAAHADMTVRPVRDASGYRRYDVQAMVDPPHQRANGAHRTRCLDHGGRTLTAADWDPDDPGLTELAAAMAAWDAHP
jgi:hypothetical protein